MKVRYLAVGVATAIAFGAAPVLADHNSTNGEGWANMPNDIHNTRIETKEANDNDGFRDFVKYGAGSESENRFASDDTTAAGTRAQNGNAVAAKTQTKQMDGTLTQTRQMDGTRSKTQVKDQKRSRIDMPDSAMARSRSNQQSAGARRGGRGKR